MQNKQPIQKYIRVMLVIVSLMLFTACTPASKYLTQTTTPTKNIHYEKPTKAKMEHYTKTMKLVASGIKHDPKYQRIALDTPEKKAWFRSLTYRLWDRQMTRQQFMAEGLAKYPDRRYEFQFVIDGFATVCR